MPWSNCNIVNGSMRLLNKQINPIVSLELAHTYIYNKYVTA